MGAVMSLSISPLSPILQFMALSTVSVILTVLVPFTKVEESFGMQAIHDFIYLSEPQNVLKFTANLFNTKTFDDYTNGSQLFQKLFDFDRSSDWDHNHFPGVVHRTFIGPFIISVLSKPMAYWIQSDDKFFVQIMARIVLSVAVMYSFSLFGRAVQLRFGSTTRRALSVLTLTQFHFLFYSSRSLPNTFALIAVMVAFAKWLEKKWNHYVIVVAFTVVVLRVETLVLFAWITAYEVIVTRELTVWRLLKVGVPAGVVSLVITVAFDSYVWAKPVWPEGDALLFNVYENRSHEWGTQPFLWYFYSALPRAMLLTIIFVPFCCQQMLKTLASVSALFLLSYSFLPHKELRFVIYAVPLLNACAANTIAVVIERFEDSVAIKNESFLVSKVWNYLRPSEESAANGAAGKDENKYDAIPANNRSVRRRGHKHVKSVEDDLDQQYERITAAQLMNSNDKYAVPNGWCMTFAFIVMAIHVWCNVAATVFMTLAAWHNYPGGEALSWLNHHVTTVDNYHERSTIGVYVCNLAAQTGFTRFLELDAVYYDKSPKLIDERFVRFAITYLVLEKSDVQSLQSRCSGTGSDVSCHIGHHIRNCRILKSIAGFTGLDFSLSRQVVRTAPMLWIFRCQK